MPSLFASRPFERNLLSPVLAAIFLPSGMERACAMEQRSETSSRPPLFAFAFDEALFAVRANKPAARPLSYLPPTLKTRNNGEN